MVDGEAGKVCKYTSVSMCASPGSPWHRELLLSSSSSSLPPVARAGASACMGWFGPC